MLLNALRDEDSDSKENDGEEIESDHKKLNLILKMMRIEDDLLTMLSLMIMNNEQSANRWFRNYSIFIQHE